MSATTTIAPLQRSASSLSFGGVIRSEWIKLRSLRSTVWAFLILVAMSLGMAWLMGSSMVDGLVDSGEAANAPVEQVRSLMLTSSTVGVFFGQLVVGVLGVLIISGEYSTGMIRSTLTAVPRRLPALAGKAIVLAASTFVIGLLSTFGAFAVVSLVFGEHGAAAPITDPDVFLPLIGGAAYLALTALFALGVGTAIRSSAGGIAAVLGFLLLLPTVLQMIPAEWVQDLIPYLFSTAGMGMFGQTSFTGEIDSVIENLLIVLAWVAAALVGAGILLKRRDA